MSLRLDRPKELAWTLVAVSSLIVVLAWLYLLQPFDGGTWNPDSSGVVDWLIVVLLVGVGFVVSVVIVAGWLLWARVLVDAVSRNAHDYRVGSKAAWVAGLLVALPIGLLTQIVPAVTAVAYYMLVPRRAGTTHLDSTPESVPGA